QVVREGLADNERGKAVSIPSKRYKALAAAARILPAKVLAGPPHRAE
ncbi:MAG: family oxidoreductase, partial [Arthrobacter sp.]|nr:family oxidoreductase [Arthrobacter sp.]